MVLPTTINQLLFIQEDVIATKDRGTKMFPSHPSGHIHEIELELSYITPKFGNTYDCASLNNNHLKFYKRYCL
jgi:hypothetical protein